MVFTSNCTSKVISTLLVLAFFSLKVAGQDCQLCPNGGEMAFPDKTIPSGEESGFATCDDLESLLSMIPEAACAGTLSFPLWTTQRSAVARMSHLLISAAVYVEAET